LTIPLSSEQVERLVAYVSLLNRWNRRIRLVGPRTEEQIVDDHIIDSLAMAHALGRLNPTPARQEPAAARPSSVVDVGTGAGLPGIAVAILWPQSSLTLCEPNEKKCSFLYEVARMLDFHPIIYGRSVEQLIKERPASFDHALTRATFDSRRWCTMGERLVVPTGVTWFMFNYHQIGDIPTRWRWEYVLPSGKIHRIEATWSARISTEPDFLGV
jgi:16S rRNA (guanine527-N7)-methyltransferase